MPLFRRAALLLAALALLGAGAAPLRAPAPLYRPAATAWAGPLGGALASPALTASLTPALASLSLDTPGGLRASAPLVAHLEGSLGYSPAAFAALPAADRASAVQLAAEAAREELRAKVYELSAQARAFARLGQLDKEQRAELYGLVARLTELRDHYGAYVDEAEREETARAYTLAAGEAWKARRALLGETVGEHAQAPGTPARPAAARRYRGPSSAAAKLRERMQDSMVGWGQDDFRDLYLGHGFEERQGGKHRFYSHVDFPDLHQTVSRQDDLPIGYARDALKLLRELDRRLAAPSAAVAAANLAAAQNAPPATLTLDDLSILLSPPSAKPKVKEAEPPQRPAPVPRRVAEKTRPDAEPVAAAANPFTGFAPAAPAVEEKARPEPSRRPAAALAPYQPSEAAPKEELPPPAQPADEGLVERLRRLFPRLDR